MVKLVVSIYKQYTVGWQWHEKEFKVGGGGEANTESKYGKVVILYPVNFMLNLKASDVGELLSSHGVHGLMW